MLLIASSFQQQGDDGLLLFHLMSSDNTLLIENEGEVAHTWPGVMEPRFSVQLQDNRMLLRTLNISQDGIEGSGDHV